MTKFLILVDCSYWMYHTIYGAITTFQNDYPTEASHWLKPIEETDQDNLPDLLNCDLFKHWQLLICNNHHFLYYKSY